MSVWCILAAPLIIGSDVRRLSATALATLSNKRAIEINQDPAMNLPFQPAWLAVPPPTANRNGAAVDVVVWARALASRPVSPSSSSSSSPSPSYTEPPRAAEREIERGQRQRRVVVSVTNMAASTHNGTDLAQPPVSVAVNVTELGLGESAGCTWPGTLTDVWTGTTIVLGSGTSGDPAVAIDHIPWHATRLLVVEVVCTAALSTVVHSPLPLPLRMVPAARAPLPGPLPDSPSSQSERAPPAGNRTVAVWWKPRSLAGLAAEVHTLRSTLAATDVLIYCGYAALQNGSFGVSPNASQQTWGNVSLCAAAVQQATEGGLRSMIMVEGRATLGFEAAVRRGGGAFGAEMAAQVLGDPPSQPRDRDDSRRSYAHDYGPGLRGFCFDFEHKAGTHGRVNVSAKAYAGFLRGVGASLPLGLEVTVAAATGWPFMSNFSLLLSAGSAGGNAAALFDMALYHGANATQWASQLDAALANAAGKNAGRGGGGGAAVPLGASLGGSAAGAVAFGAGLSLRAGQSTWERTPASVADRFRALEGRGVRSVGVFEFTHGGLPNGLTPAMTAAWTAALRAFVANERGH